MLLCQESDECREVQASMIESRTCPRDFISRVGYDKFANGTGVFYQSGNFENATGHIDAMYKGIVGGHLYKKQPTNYLYY